MSTRDESEADLLVRDWLRSLRARNLAAKTQRTYGDAARQLIAHSGAEQSEEFDRRAVEDYLADQAAHCPPPR